MLYPSKVQGIGAENELVRGIEYFNTREDIDVIIVGRGAVNGVCEFKNRQTMEKVELSKEQIISEVVNAVKNIK